MKLLIIGVGKMGSAIAYSLMLMRQGNAIHLYEPKCEQVGKAEFLDLAPVADATNNNLIWAEGLGQAFSRTSWWDQRYDAVILTAGIPRTDSSKPKSALLKENLPIAEALTRYIPSDTPVFVVTNPPNEIARELNRRGQKAIPLRQCTDALRANCQSPFVENVNSFVLNHKGYTMWTPAYACAREILVVMERGRQGMEG